MPTDATTALLATTAARLEAIDTEMPAKVREAQTCPAPLLGHLAWSRSLDYWSSTWPEATKRELIRTTPANLRRRGTRAAINAALSAFAAQVQMAEWWEQSPLGVPGTARATVDFGTVLGRSPEGQRTVIALLAREGRASLHWTLDVGVQGQAVLGMRGVARVEVLLQIDGVQRAA